LKGIPIFLQKALKEIRFREIFFFLGNGLFTATTYYILLFIFMDITKIHYIISTAISFFIATTLQFCINKFITFKNVQDGIINQAIKTYIIIFISLVITALTVWIMVGFFEFSPYTSNLFVLCITTPISFLMSKFWVFKTYREGC